MRRARAATRLRAVLASLPRHRGLAGFGLAVLGDGESVALAAGDSVVGGRRVHRILHVNNSITEDDAGTDRQSAFETLNTLVDLGVVDSAFEVVVVDGVEVTRDPTTHL